jgi:hypothetical protein
MVVLVDHQFPLSLIVVKSPTLAIIGISLLLPSLFPPSSLLLPILTPPFEIS